MENLETLIKKRKASVAVIGLGYVGLPHAVEIAKAGFSVIGIDLDEKKVKNLNSGKSFIEDVDDNDLLKVLKNNKFRAYTDSALLKSADVVLISVPTPLDQYKIPDVSYIKSAVLEIKKTFHKGELIILESTTYPGTTEEIILPSLQENGFEVGKDFHLAFAPERIDPGSSTHISEIPKVVGGVTKKCTNLADLFYKQFISETHKVSSPKAAEMTKLLENAYRLVNISTVNELSLLCDRMGIDIWEIIDAASTKPYGFQAFYPSPKVGGHCIPLDPFYLSWKAKQYNFWAKFIDLAGEINEQMPHFVVTKVYFALNKISKSIRGSKILILGAAFKKNVSDARDSAFLDVVPDLLRKGALVDYYDPFVEEIEVATTPLPGGEKVRLKSAKLYNSNLNTYDCALILTDHTGIDYETIAKKVKVVVDTRNAIRSRKFKNVYRIGG